MKEIQSATKILVIGLGRAHGLRVGGGCLRQVTIVAERGDGVGSYGAKGRGEGTLNPIGGATAAAVARAIGRWPDRLPLTPERVWRLMRNGDS